jgi:hypothetical protein
MNNIHYSEADFMQVTGRTIEAFESPDPTSVCVECLFFKDTGVQPHLSVGLISVRQKGGLPGHGG